MPDIGIVSFDELAHLCDPKKRRSDRVLDIGGVLWRRNEVLRFCIAAPGQKVSNAGSTGELVETRKNAASLQTSLPQRVAVGTHLHVFLTILANQATQDKGPGRMDRMMATTEELHSLATQRCISIIHDYVGDLKRWLPTVEVGGLENSPLEDG